MSTPAKDGSWALTDKEKQTLRLMVRGHDAKSIARSLGLSVHTINERLRDARRKMAVSSSREAARLLLEVEGDGGAWQTPDLSVDAGMGEDATPCRVDQGTTSFAGVHRSIIIGGILMTLVLGLLALTALPHVASTPPQTPTASKEAPNPEVVESARQWLVLVDQARWDESYRGTGSAFRKLNTAKVWAEVSEKVRVPLGALVSRTLISQENLPAPPNGYEVVKFRTSFANKADTMETVTLEREDGGWRIVGITIG